MKYTIEGFSQEYAATLKDEKTHIDCVDLVILRWFVDFQTTGKMEFVDVGSDRFFWVNYNSLLEDMPILSLSKRAIYDRLQKMVKFGLLKHYHKKSGGSFSCYCTGPNYSHLVKSPLEANFTPLGSKLPTPMKQTSDPLGSKLPNKDHSTNNPSTKDPSTKDFSVFEEFAKDNEELLESLKAFEEMRKTIKKPLTEKAKRLVCNKLEKMAMEVIDKERYMIESLEQSTVNCYREVFPVKDFQDKAPEEEKIELVWPEFNPDFKTLEELIP